jgi:hypothetical protein
MFGLEGEKSMREVKGNEEKGGELKENQKKSAGKRRKSSNFSRISVASEFSSFSPAFFCSLSRTRRRAYQATQQNRQQNSSSDCQIAG